MHHYAGSPHDPEGWLSAIGFGAPFIGAGLVGLIGAIRSRGPLMLMAGVAVLPMSILSVVLIPLVLPAAVLIVYASTLGVDSTALAVPIAIAAVLVAALGYLVFHQDPAEWSTPQGGGGSSNIVTSTEALIAIGAAAFVGLAAATAP